MTTSATVPSSSKVELVSSSRLLTRAFSKRDGQILYGTGLYCSPAESSRLDQPPGVNQTGPFNTLTVCRRRGDESLFLSTPAHTLTKHARSVAQSAKMLTFPSQVPDFTLSRSFSPRLHQPSNLGTLEPPNPHRLRFTTFQITPCSVQPLAEGAFSRYLQITKTLTYNAVSHLETARAARTEDRDEGELLLTTDSIPSPRIPLKTPAIPQIPHISQRSTDPADSSPGGEDTDEGVLPLSSREPLRQIGNRPSEIANDHFSPVYRRLWEIISFGKKAPNQTETELRLN